MRNFIAPRRATAYKVYATRYSYSQKSRDPRAKESIVSFTTLRIQKLAEDRVIHHLEIRKRKKGQKAKVISMGTQGSDIIRATARFQEVSDPLKQKPIIQIDSSATATATTTTQHLPNTIRSSMDSGRDNPFRPDGEIYRSADPIVDYYKHGPNQSRAQSPTDSQLLLNNKGNSRKDSDSKKKKRKKKTAGEEEGKTKKSCWRRWLCCCCCCNFKCCGKGKESEEKEDETRKKLTVDETTTSTTTTTVADLAPKESKQSKLLVVSTKPVQLPTQPQPSLVPER